MCKTYGLRAKEAVLADFKAAAQLTY